VSSSRPLSLSDESASSSFCYTSQSSCHYEKEEIYIVLRETQFPSRVTRMHRLVSVFETSNSALVCHSLKKPTGSQWHILTLICGPSLVKGCGDRCMVGTKLFDILNAKQQLILTLLNILINVHSFQVFNIHIICM
jgi:hypothetical protein